MYFELGRFQGLRGSRRGSGTAHLQGFNPAGGMDVSCGCCVLSCRGLLDVSCGCCVLSCRGLLDVSCGCCVLSCRGLCVGLIIRPGEPYRVLCLNVIVKPRYSGGPGPLGAVASLKERYL